MPKGIPLSTERKAAISAAAKQRWATAKAAGQTSLRVPRPEGAPPDPPSNYGIIPESRLPGGAIDPATRDIGGVGEAALERAQGRSLAPDVVGNLGAPRQPRANVRIARSESDLPFTRTAEPKPNGKGQDDVPAVDRTQVGAAAVHRLPPNALLAAEEGAVLALPNWETVDLQEGQDSLDAAHSILTQAALILQRRLGERAQSKGTLCRGCGTLIADAKLAKMIQAIRDPETGIIENHMWCSFRCFNGGVAAGKFGAQPPAAK
jgi:hypothetical protein